MKEKQKISVLFLIGSYGTGGKERQLAELIKGLDASEFELHLIVKSDTTHYLGVIKNQLTSYHNPNRKRFGLKSVYSIGKLIAAIKPDIVHSWAETTSIISILIKLLLFANFRIIDGSIRNSEKIKTYDIIERIQRLINNTFSDLIITNSNAGLEVHGLPKKKTKVIYNGFDLSRINSSYKNKEQLIIDFGIKTEFIIGMVARFNNGKDWKTFLKIAVQITNLRNDVTFIAIGGGKDLQIYQDKLTASNREKIIFTGERSDVESIVSIFDIGLLTTFTEGISNSVLEYMALKKPVVATGGGGLKELIEHNKTGFLFEQADVDNAIFAIQKLLNERDLRIVMAEEGYKKILTNFSFSKMISLYTDVYHTNNL